MRNKFLYCYGLYFTGKKGTTIFGNEQLKVCVCSLNPDTLVTKFIIDAETGEKVDLTRFWRKVSGKPKSSIEFELPEMGNNDYAYSAEDLEDLKKL